MSITTTLFENELKLIREFGVIAGADEAGRGPLIGPVVCAAVILGECFIEGLNDSKKIPENKRESLYEAIVNKAVCFNIQIVDERIIDEMNILAASLYGMKKAVENLEVFPDLCLFDGNKLPKEMIITGRPIVKGDAKYASIAAASILAKVTRDRLMMELDKKYPEYNFAKNKGYPTEEHLEAIRKFGIVDEHRRSFKPVSQLVIAFD